MAKQEKERLAAQAYKMRSSCAQRVKSQGAVVWWRQAHVEEGSG